MAPFGLCFHIRKSAAEANRKCVENMAARFKVGMFPRSHQSARSDGIGSVAQPSSSESLASGRGRTRKTDSQTVEPTA